MDWAGLEAHYKNVKPHTRAWYFKYHLFVVRSIIAKIDFTCASMLSVQRIRFEVEAVYC